jgi:hypothetical protein
MSNYCIHSYLNQCQSAHYCPGFGDWLRGTVTLWKYCKKYNYELYIDPNIHPIFQYLEDHPCFLAHTLPVQELISPLSYVEIDAKLQELFLKNESFATLTNAIYDLESPDVYADITPNECKDFIRSVLTPNQLLKNNLDKAYQQLGIDCNREYRVIHLRFGDNYLFQNTFDQEYYNSIYWRIEHLVTSESEYQYILLCDTAVFGQKIKQDFPQIHYWDNHKTHLGTADQLQDGVLDTLTDFFIMSKACAILTIFDSGFSRMCTRIYDITFYRI